MAIECRYLNDLRGRYKGTRVDVHHLMAKAMQVHGFNAPEAHHFVATLAPEAVKVAHDPERFQALFTGADPEASRDKKIEKLEPGISFDKERLDRAQERHEMAVAVAAALYESKGLSPAEAEAKAKQMVARVNARVNQNKYEQEAERKARVAKARAEQKARREAWQRRRAAAASATAEEPSS